MEEKYGIELELLTSNFKKQIENVKRQCNTIGETLQANKNTEVEINNEQAKKQILQLEKEIESLQKKIESKTMKFEIDTSALNKIREATRQNVLEENPDIGAKQLNNRTELKLFSNENAVQLTTEVDKLNQEIEKYNLLLSSAKEKLNEIKATGLDVRGQQAEEEINEAKNSAKLLNKELNKTKTTKLDFGGNINQLNKGLDKATSKVKKIGLALFSIRGIYSLISRASSAYLSQDTELANKLQAVWVGLGAMLEPIISAIANVLLKAVKYINVFIKALTGVDLLAKATTKSLKNTTNSVKNLSKVLANWDELNNLDTTTNVSTASPFSVFDDVDLNPEWVSKIQDFASWVKENIPIVVGILAGLALVLSGNGGVAAGLGAVCLAGDGLYKLFSEDLNTSVVGLIEILGAAGLIGVLTGNAGLAVGIGAVALALFGLNEMINGDTTQAIEGLILLLGGAGLVGYLIGGATGTCVAIAIASVISLLKGLNDLINGDLTDSTKGFIEIVVGASGLVLALSMMKSGISGLLKPTNLVIIGLIALAAGVALVMKNWDNMSTLQKVVSVLGLIAIGAAAAAAAVGALQSAWSLGIAAAAIVAGTVAIAASVASAQKTAEDSVPKLAVGTNYVPEDQLAYIHKGEAVVPKKFNSQEYFGNGSNETNSLLEQVIEAINNIEINPYTTVKDVGKTAVNYINSKNRQLGGSVIL